MLRRVVDALRTLPVRVALAAGAADPAAIGEVPGHWLVREFLPQVALLERSAAAVTHGGNNSVTESLTSGVPMLVLPFSTDQFAGAAALERAGVGVALDPNAASTADLRAALEGSAAGRNSRSGTRSGIDDAGQARAAACLRGDDRRTAARLTGVSG